MSNIFLHFVADFNALVRLDETTLGTLDNPSDRLTVEVGAEQSLMLSVFPILDNTSEPSIPFSVKLKSEKEGVTTDSNQVQITDFGHGHFEIRLVPLIIKPHLPTLVLDRINLSDETVAELTDSGVFRLEIFVRNKRFSFELSHKITQHKITEFTKDEVRFVLLEGKTPKNQAYLMVLSNFFCNLELIADFIEHTQSEITSLTHQLDIASHGVVRKYEIQGKRFALTEEYTVFLDTAPHLPTDPKTVPWAFMEALNLGNLSLARSFLEKELSSSLTDEHLKTFFGDYEEIQWNRYRESTNTLCVIYAGNPRVVQTFEFEINNNKICNITKKD